MTRALVEPSVSELSDLPAEDSSRAPILELPFPNQSIQTERERIVSEFARELHDQLAQPLTGMLVQTEVFIREQRDRKSTRLNSSHQIISYAVFCLKKKKKNTKIRSMLHLTVESLIL